MNKEEKIKIQKRMIDDFPFLAKEEEDEFPMIDVDLPSGWFECFILMCKDLREAIAREGIEDYYLIQVKEKYDMMKCYPNKSIPVLDEILTKYQQMSYYICVICGEPADVTTTNSGQLSFCKDCLNRAFEKRPQTMPITFAMDCEVLTYVDGKNKREVVSFADEWCRYLKALNDTMARVEE